ncbi:MAG: MATE family efflux transporter [Ruminiclostridium sp.]|jgi:putative MATE family efflux protein|nr:MATE family efflux transporter [Ruminiclostridium sp.]MCI9465786.1 MATE family efflux transporter [Ruminiclostridium sp.]
MARIHLSEHFTYKKLLRFVLPSVLMMIFTSIYSVVDGLFVSNFVGTTAFAAVNLIYPLVMMLSSVGFMLGTGGTAIIGKTLGEGQREEANRYFTMLIAAVVLFGAVLAALGILFLRPVSILLGAEGALLDDCIRYGRVILAALPFFALQVAVQELFVVAEKASLGLGVTVLSGVVNMVLDALFVAGFHWGLLGAAFATAISQVVGAVVPVLYFARPNDSLLRFTKALHFYPKVLGKACANGSSEMVSNLASSLVSLLYNYQLLRLLGENGVAAYGVIMYVGFIFAAVNLGYAMGASPIISFQYGAENHSELKNLYRKSLLLLSAGGLGMFLIAKLVARPLSLIFVSYDPVLLELTVHAFHIIAFAFLLNGLNTFASAFFTALNNGAVSAVLSFLRTFVFQIVGILGLPLLFGVDGLWAAMAVTECASFFVSLYCFLSRRRRYQYG